MKQPRKLTRNEKESVLAQGLNPDKYMVQETTDFYLKIIHKESGEVKRVDRYARMKKGDKRYGIKKKTEGVKTSTGNKIHE